MKKLFSITLAYLMFLLLFQILTTPIGRADSLWASDNVGFEIEEIDRERYTTLKCDNHDFYKTYLKQPLRILGNLVLLGFNKTYRPIGTRCYVKNGAGLISKTDNFWAPDGSDKVISLSTSYSNFRAIPGEGSNGLIVSRDYATNNIFRFASNFDVIGRYEFAYLSNEDLVWTVTTSEPVFKFKDGSYVILFNQAFSSNGKYMIATTTTGLIKINVETKEMTLIGKAWGGGSNIDEPNLAISNDGRYAYSSVMDRVYDLNGCTIKYSYNNWISSYPRNEVAEGCVYTDLRNKIYSQTSAVGLFGRGDTVFSDDSEYINKYFYSDKDGIRKYYSLKIKSPLYTDSRGYLALGDSFSSGEGDSIQSTHYELGTDVHGTPENLCHLSNRSYPYLIASELYYKNNMFHSVACSGARASNITTNSQADYINGMPLGLWLPGYSKQLSHLYKNEQPDANMKPRAITIGIGGNDAGFKDVITKCILTICDIADTNNSDPRSDLIISIANLKTTLVSTYIEVRKASPESRVYAIGYPQILSTDSDIFACKPNVPLSAKERYVMSKATTYMNEVIRSAAKEAGVSYIDVEDILEGGKLCEGGSMVNGIEEGDDIGRITVNGFTIGILGNESFHPNYKAHIKYADQILTVTSRLTRENPTPTKTQLPVPDSYFGQKAIDYVDNLNAKSNLSSIVVPTQVDFIGHTDAYKRIAINQKGFTPNSDVKSLIMSTPTDLATLRSDANGEISAELDIPPSIEAGYHEIHLKGIAKGGEEVDYYQSIVVAGNDENDIDDDGIPNDQDKCTFIEQANIDEDHDGVDDGCDGFIDEPPAPADSTAPTVSGSVAEQPNENGWYNHDVSVTWSSSDTGDGSDGTATIPQPTIANIEGEHEYESGQSCDKANNCATGKHTVRIDKTAPEVVPSFSQQPNENGWNNQGITISFTCNDQHSGIASCPQEITVREEGITIVPVRSIDIAGNVFESNIAVKIDKTAPTISYSRFPLANQNGWNNSDVEESFVCSDELSGAVGCPLNVTHSTEGITNNRVITVSDLAGNTSSITTEKVMIDKTAPVLLEIVWSNNPTVAYSATTFTTSVVENGSGVATANYSSNDSDIFGQMTIGENSISSTINSLNSGIYNVRIGASDLAGNNSISVEDYLVVSASAPLSIKASHPLVQLQGSSQLPGITDEPGAFGLYEVKVNYDVSGQLTDGSFGLGYSNTRACLVSNRTKTTCSIFKIKSTRIGWIVGDQNKVVVSGKAQLNFDGISQEVVFKVELSDGQHAGLNYDSLDVKLYQPNDNIFTAEPLYHLGPIELPLGSNHIN